ncbi:MAG: UDP-N-acetylmuramoyl-tripeptide--D-alanyl-D-alanine ligase [Acidimicrobiales bacterium]
MAEVAAATGGEVTGEATVDGAAIDSRGDVTGRLFVAVVAERDGHAFVDAAVDAGAAAVLVDRAVGAVGAPVVQVPDTGRALADLGRAARSRLPDLVVGVTGSVGKTTVKDLCAGALRSSLRTAASERSFNNELGVPLTLLNAPAETEVVVLEMGARGPGHIAALCEVASPTIGVMTAVAAVHTETFGTVDDVARAKAELVAALPATGTAVLNVDDPRVAAMAGVTTARVLRFGLADSADVSATDVVLDEDLRPSFMLRTPWGRAPVRLTVRGVHQVGNALGAAGAALAAGTPLDAVAAGLAAPPASPWRMALERSPSGLVVLNDAYNANPTSMEAALRSLAELAARRRIAYLGTMAELGPGAADAHAATACLGAELGITVVAVGEPAYGVEEVADVDAAAAHAAALGLGDGDAVLVKASRVAGLERLAERLLEPPR